MCYPIDSANLPTYMLVRVMHSGGIFAIICLHGEIPALRVTMYSTVLRTDTTRNEPITSYAATVWPPLAPLGDQDDVESIKIYNVPHNAFGVCVY